MSVPLSICIPTYERPDRLTTALGSVLAAPSAVLDHVQVVVSDNSRDRRSAEVAERLGARHPRGVEYHRHVPGVGMVGNFNACIELARGRHVLILHDDDYLLPGGTSALVDTVAEHDDPALVFGAEVVDAEGRRLQDRTPEQLEHLTREEALRRLLSHSSFVRFPAMVVRRDAYAAIGGFDPELAGACDLGAWVELAAAHGLTLVPRRTAAYVVHPDADTESVFTIGTLRRVNEIFERARRHGWLDPEELHRCQANYVHQFVLGGTWRALRARDRERARQRLDLLRHDEVRPLGAAPRWLPVAAAMRLLTVGARPPETGGPSQP